MFSLRKILFIFILYSVHWLHGTEVFFASSAVEEQTYTLPVMDYGAIYAVDPNEDGFLNIFDLIYILEILYKDSTTVRADLNQNGRIDIFDLIELLKYLADPPKQGNARIIIKVRDPEPDTLISGARLSTSFDLSLVFGTILDPDVEPGRGLFIEVLMDKTIDNGIVYWGNSVEIEAGKKIGILVVKFIDPSRQDPVSHSGRCEEFFVRSGSIYHPEINYFDKPFVIKPRIEKVSETEQYVVWDSMPNASSTMITERSNGFSAGQVSKVPRYKLEKPDAGEIMISFIFWTYMGLWQGETVRYVYRPAEGIFEKIE